MNTAWVVRGGRLVKPAPFCLVGIVNATPDSFFDGGHYYTDVHTAASSMQLTTPQNQTVAHALQLLDEGAHLLDIGAESTRPGATALGPNCEAASAVELARLMPVVTGVRAARPDALVCVDTCHAATARAMLAQGVDVINDVSAFTRDPALLELLAAEQPGYVLMHGGDQGGVVPAGKSYGFRLAGAASSSSSCSGDIVDQVLRFFSARLECLERAGLSADHVVLDPGIGFGKTVQENIALLRGIHRLHVLGRPLYVGLSMKSLFGTLFGLPLAARGEATRVATALLAARGVCYHRVHEPAPAAIALSMAEWFYQGKSEACVPCATISST